MKPNRLDDIFQVYRGIPIICGLYIGMDFSSTVERLKELYNYRNYHYYDYPADLIYNMGIDVDFEMFEESKNVKSILLSFSKSTNRNDVIFLKNYLSEKYYYKRSDEFIQRDAGGKILSYMIDIYNEYYYFTIYSKEDSTLAVQFRAAIEDESIYDAINIICSNRRFDENFIYNYSCENLFTSIIDNVETFLCINKLLSNNNCENYFIGLSTFYKYGGDTQDARFNELRRKYDTFLDGVRDYMTMCNFKYKNESDILIDIDNASNQFLNLWNTPGSVFPTY